MARISIRPAPHAKFCALDGYDCGNSDPNKCFTACNHCCELKHCWRLGWAVADKLKSRGHEVIMADFSKQLHDSSADTREVIDNAIALKCDLHVALHTNANSNKNVRGINIGYKKGNAEGQRAAVAMMNALSAKNPTSVYDSNVKVTTDYDFIEINRAEAGGMHAIYIEAGYGDTNTDDASWIHNNIDAIATAMADGIEAYTGKAVQPVIPPQPTGNTVTVDRAQLQAVYDMIGNMLA